MSRFFTVLTGAHGVLCGTEPRCGFSICRILRYGAARIWVLVNRTVRYGSVRTVANYSISKTPTPDRGFVEVKFERWSPVRTPVFRIIRRGAVRISFFDNPKVQLGAVLFMAKSYGPVRFGNTTPNRTAPCEQTAA